MICLTVGLCVENVPASSLPLLSRAPLDTGLASNFVVDIIGFNGGVWLASSKGVNSSYDSGSTWLRSGRANGMVSQNVSAFYGSSNNRLWIGTSHVEDISGSLFSISDGVSYSDDFGQTWTQVNFGEDGLDIPFVWGGDRTVFDITGKGGASASSDQVFFSAFAGGLLGSNDGGTNWRRFYGSRDDSIQYNDPNQAPSLRNLYFSCAVDSTHTDSLYLWAGTAAGLFQYVFADSGVKPFVSRVLAIDILPGSSGDTGLTFYAGVKGVTRGTTAGGPYATQFTTDGLPGPVVTSVRVFAGRIFCGTRASINGNSTGLAVSDDNGQSYTHLSTFDPVFAGANRTINEFALISDRIYLAGTEAGLHVSTDSGQNWTKVIVDPIDTTLTNRRNVVHSVHALSDTLFLGTDSGLVILFLDPSGAIDSSRYKVFPDAGSTGSRVIRVRTQLFGDTTTTVDSVTIWTIHRTAGGGQPMLGRSEGFRDTLFTSLRVGAESNDICFLGDSAIVSGGTRGLFYGRFGGQQLSTPLFVRELRAGIPVDSLTLDTCTTLLVLGDTMIIGTTNGFARSIDRARTWDIVRINADRFAPDATLNFDGSISGISGDWFPVLGLQQIDTDPFARVWASSRRTFDGADGIVLGVQDTLIGIDTIPNPDDTVKIPVRAWRTMLTDRFAWNFAFHGDTTFAATDGGLLVTTYTTGASIVWDTIDLVDTSGVSLVTPGSPVYAVEVVEPYLWVGTEDRTIRMSLSDFGGKVAYGKQDTDSPADQVFAFPVPFSHSRDRTVDFRFVLESTDRVSIEVYDFALNLVKRVADGVALGAGTYPGSGSNRLTWDGRNGKDALVAVGVYYFKVELGSGEVRWGKLAVIP